MISALFWFALGLVIGWNLLPQPTWVKTTYDKVKDQVLMGVPKNTD